MLDQENLDVNNAALSSNAENDDGNDPNSVNPDSQSGGNSQNPEELLYNRQRELDRKLEKANAIMEELNRQKAEFQKAQANSNFNEDEFLGDIATRIGILDEKNKPDIVSTKKLVSLIDLVTENKFRPNIDKIEELMTTKDYNDYDVYKDEMTNILGNELKNVRMPRKEKLKIAYEMAKGRNPKTSMQSNVSVARPNMATSSVGASSSTKTSGLTKEEINYYTEYAKSNNVPLDRLLERAKKINKGYRGA